MASKRLWEPRKGNDNETDAFFIQEAGAREGEVVIAGSEECTPVLWTASTSRARRVPALMAGAVGFLRRCRGVGTWTCAAQEGEHNDG
jgi:hypothetical protein